MAENKEESLFINIIIAAIVVLLTIVFFFLYRYTRKSKRTVLITGISDSGKTLIFNRLIRKDPVKTYTSILENVYEYTTPKDRKVQLVDIPGQERVRGKFLEQYKKDARAIIFVLDSLTLQKDIRDVADYLYTILTDVDLYSCKNVLIFCNKQDHTTAKGISVIKNLLEKELNTVRNTRSHSLKSTDGSETNKIYLGFENEDFDFTQLLPTVVTFAEGYALNKDEENAPDNLDEMKNWISQL